jgi:hypothetical protein
MALLKKYQDGGYYRYNNHNYKKEGDKWFKEINGKYLPLTAGNVEQRTAELNKNAIPYSNFNTANFNSLPRVEVAESTQPKNLLIANTAANIVEEGSKRRAAERSIVVDKIKNANWLSEEDKAKILLDTNKIDSYIPAMVYPKDPGTIQSAPEYTWADKAGNIIRNPLVATAYFLKPGPFNMPMNYSAMERSPGFSDPVFDNNTVLKGLNAASYLHPTTALINAGNDALYTEEDIRKAIKSGKMEDWQNALTSTAFTALDLIPGTKLIGRSGRLMNMGESAALETMRLSNSSKLNNIIGNKIIPRISSTPTSVANDFRSVLVPQLNPASAKYNPIVRKAYNKAVVGAKAQDVGQATGSVFEPVINNTDEIIFGHPTIGKSYLKQAGDNRFLSLDDDYADVINNSVNDIAKKYNISTYQVKNGGNEVWNKEYNQMMQSLFDEVKKEAKSKGQVLFTSNTNLLRNNLDSFDKIINIPKDEFVKRIEKRGAKYDITEWKNSIDEVVAKADKSKVINTNKYLSDLLPTQDFKSEIDWGKWNKEIPENKALMQEYNAIEQQAKADGTWMKYSDGTKFNGSPEQFVQMKSKNLTRFAGGEKQAENMYKNVLYHGTPARDLTEFDLSKAERLTSGNLYPDLIFTTTNKNIAKTYAGDKGKVLELGANLGKNKSVDYKGNSWIGKKSGYVVGSNNKEGMQYDAFGNMLSPEGNTFRSKQAAEKYLKSLPESAPYKKDMTIQKNDFLDPNARETSPLTTNKLAERYKKQGFDSFTAKNVVDNYDNSLKLKPGEDIGDDVIFFKGNNRLKSLIGNNGMFDMTNPNIYKALAPIGLGSLLYNPWNKKQN